MNMMQHGKTPGLHLPQQLVVASAAAAAAWHK
jgi:hypothetical protein